MIPSYFYSSKSPLWVFVGFVLVFLFLPGNKCQAVFLCMKGRAGEKILLILYVISLLVFSLFKIKTYLFVTNELGLLCDTSLVVACGLLSLLLHSVWVPWPGIEPAPLALQGGFLTTGLPGKSYFWFSFSLLSFYCPSSLRLLGSLNPVSTSFISWNFLGLFCCLRLSTSFLSCYGLQKEVPHPLMIFPPFCVLQVYLIVRASWDPGVGSRCLHAADVHLEVACYFKVENLGKDTYVCSLSESCSCLVVSDSATPGNSSWNSPGQNTGVGSCSLLQEIFAS